MIISTLVQCSVRRTRGAMEEDGVLLFNGQLDKVAFLAKSLSDVNRLRILLCVSSEKKPVNRIVQEMNLSQALVSHHLKELKRSLLVKVERNGPFVYYEIADARILEILEKLNLVATDLLASRTSF
jgi:ArsR family transcriptional regulator, zinc-responsive transcriptional repressor